MGGYTTRVVTTRRREWIVPAAAPWGAAAAEIGKAWEAARFAYWEVNDLPKGGPIPDNALTFHVRDEEIVICFTTEVTA